MDDLLSKKIDTFNQSLDQQPIILLIKPNRNVFSETNARKNFENELEKIIDKGLVNLEIPWNNHPNWLDLMKGIKSKFPHTNLGSASITSKKSIDESLKVGLNFSMMKFWKKDLFLYSRAKNHLLIPGLNKLSHFNEANSFNCKIIKIYPVLDKEKLLRISEFKNISFIAAGGRCIKDVNKYLKLEYKSIVIGEKGYSEGLFDERILDWLLFNTQE